MADNIIGQDVVQNEVQQSNQVQSTISPEIAEMMELSLNGVIPTIKEDIPDLTQTTEVPSVDNEQKSVISSFEIIKDKFNYQSVDDAIKEIEELRGLKNTPPPSEIKFENEFNEKLFKAIQAGKVKEVNELLSQQERLESLTSLDINKDTAADIIKLGMKIKYKDLTDSEIDYKFSKQFGIPKEPVQKISEEDEDFEIRHSAWQEQVRDIEMNRIIEAKLAKPELEAAKSKITLPEIPSQIDNDYIQWKQSLEDNVKINEEVSRAYKAFTSKSIETKMPFNDEANKVSFEFQYEPDSESFNKTVDMVCDMNKFYNLFKDQNGNPDRKGFLDAIHFALNKDKILLEAMKQAKNATLKSRLPDNSQGGIQRQSVQTPETTELDKMMQQSLAGFVR